MDGRNRVNGGRNIEDDVDDEAEIEEKGPNEVLKDVLELFGRKSPLTLEDRYFKLMKGEIPRTPTRPRNCDNHEVWIARLRKPKSVETKMIVVSNDVCDGCL